MYYIFNSSNICVGICNIEPDESDLKLRDEFVVQSEGIYDIGATCANNEIVIPTILVDYEQKARDLRNTIRNQIDKYLLPASTIEDVLITEDQKNLLIQDSLSLARWPTEEGWPYISLPELSELCTSFLTIPEWPYPEQTS